MKKQKPYCYFVKYYDDVDIFSSIKELIKYWKVSSSENCDFRHFGATAKFKDGHEEEFGLEQLLVLKYVKKVKVNRKDVEEWGKNIYQHEVGIFEKEFNGKMITATGCHPVKVNATEDIIQQEIERRSYQWTKKANKICI